MEAGSARNRTASRRRAVPAPTPLRGRVFRCLFLHHQTAGRRRASRLAFVIGGRGKPRPYKGAGHVWWPCRGAPVCAPVRESSMYAAGRHIGRPLQGCKVDLYFGGVAIISFVQRAGHAPPQQRYQTIPAHKKGASPGAPACLYCYFIEYKYAYPGSGPAGPVREGGMESRGSGGPVQGPPILWP